MSSVTPNGRKIPRAVLCCILMVAVAHGALSHSTVEARLNVRGNALHRRRPTQKARGSRRDLKSEGKVEKEDEESTNKTRTAPNQLPTVNRPTRNDVLKEIEEMKGGTQLKNQSPPGGNSKSSTSKQGSQNLKSSISKQRSETTIQKKSPENGVEHFQKVEVEVYRRQIPAFSIHFTIEDPSSSQPPNMADYNELSEVSEEYLDGFFRSVFEDLQVRHDGTILFVDVNEDDPFTIDFTLMLEFIIPSEVPTINFLVDRLQDGLERDASEAFFISDLSEMSKTNPFSKTVSIEVVSRPPIFATEITGDGNQPKTSSMSSENKKSIMVSILVGMGCVVLVAVGLLWVRKRKQSSRIVSGNSSESTGVYGADKETMSYLNSIRKRYKDHDENESPISKKSLAGTCDEDDASLGNTSDTIK